MKPSLYQLESCCANLSEMKRRRRRRLTAPASVRRAVLTLSTQAIIGCDLDELGHG